MSRRSATVSLLAITVYLMGCQASPTAPGLPQPTSGLTSVTGEAKGGNGGGKGGGTGESMLVTMADGLSAEGSLTVQTNSSKTLDLSGPLMVTTGLAMTSTGGSCEQVQGQSTDITYLTDYLAGATLDTFRTVVVIDKSSLPGASGSHRITLNWEGHVMNLVEGDNGPISVVESPAGTYAFTGGDVRLIDKTGSGPPKDRVIVRCFQQDTITVSVE